MADYLLNAAHPDNGGKARYFQALGYSSSDVMQLVAALRLVAVHGETVASVTSAHGEKFVVDGQLQARIKGTPSRAVRTVWIVERGEDVPRLVTAYPREG